MKTTTLMTGMASILMTALVAGETPGRVWLDDVDITGMTSGIGRTYVGRSVDGGLLTLGGKTFEKGLGTHAPSRLVVPLAGRAVAFEATVGIDDEMKGRRSSMEFQVWADGKLLATSGRLTRKNCSATLKADLTGARLLRLEVTDGGDGIDSDHADWANAVITLTDGATALPKIEDLSTQLGILTPPAPQAPRINGPARLGVRPGSPIIYRVPVTGARPLKIDVAGLPPGATFDAARGVVGGAVARAGTYPLAITAVNAHGRATRTVDLVIGNTLSLTPAMGWNSWNCFGGRVSQEKVKAAADALVASGLADHGWNYVVIDDFWQNRPGEKNDKDLMGPPRAADGTINANARFPAMKALTDALHAQGLRAGIYSSPGPRTCGGNEGSWRHEFQDAKTFADWGFDFLKYDWCSYGQNVAGYGRVAFGGGLDYARFPYLLMGKALREQNRDILFSLCQYGMENVSAWGDTVLGSSWRTTGDVFDKWSSIAAAIRKQEGLWYWSKPGAWNDPDMLCVGKMHWNAFKGSRLTPNQQYTHMSLWCLVASPLMIGCDLTQLDAFTLNLLSNDEVLAIDQDPLGLGAAKIAESADMGEIWARPLAGGDVAVGLFNASPVAQDVVFDLHAAGLEGGWRVRDLWRQSDEGEARGVYVHRVEGHATHLVRLSPARDGRVRTGQTDIREHAWRRQIEAYRPLIPVSSTTMPCEPCKAKREEK